jgi:hypothetical protein
MRWARGVAAAVLLACASPSVAQQAMMKRPGDGGQPTRVELAIVVLEVFEISDAEETLEIDFLLEARWLDARLAWDGSAASQTASVRYGLDQAWHPGLSIVNEKQLSTRLPAILSVAPDGSVRQVQRYQGVLTADLALRNFPFDRQRLPVRIATAGHSPAEVELSIDRDELSVEKRQLAGWRVEMGEPEVGVFELSSGERAMAQATFTIEAERESRYFVWTLLLPLTMIVFMAWMVFWIDPTLLPTQVGISTAAIFSMIAFRTALRVSLPHVSYLTKADVFILGCTLIVFLALAHAVASGRLARSGRESLARRMDRVGRWVYVLVFVGVLALTRSW